MNSEKPKPTELVRELTKDASEAQMRRRFNEWSSNLLMEHGTGKNTCTGQLVEGNYGPVIIQPDGLFTIKGSATIHTVVAFLAFVVYGNRSVSENMKKTRQRLWNFVREVEDLETGYQQQFDKMVGTEFFVTAQAPVALDLTINSHVRHLPLTRYDKCTIEPSYTIEPSLVTLVNGDGNKRVFGQMSQSNFNVEVSRFAMVEEVVAFLVFLIRSNPANRIIDSAVEELVWYVVEMRREVDINYHLPVPTPTSLKVKKSRPNA